MYTHRGETTCPRFRGACGATLVTVWQVPYFWIYADVLGNESRNKGGRGVSLGVAENKGARRMMIFLPIVRRCPAIPNPFRHFYARYNFLELFQRRELAEEISYGAPLLHYADNESAFFLFPFF